MNSFSILGKPYPQKGAYNKASGKTHYLEDLVFPGLLHASLVLSHQCHGEILGIDFSEAVKMEGVRAVLAGEEVPENLGIYTGDKPPLARGRIRHYGEPVAAVVADTLQQAEAACRAVKVNCKTLPYLGSPKEALASRANLIHPDMEGYKHVPFIYPEPGTNIANRTLIHKGDTCSALDTSAYRVAESFSFPPGCHGSLECRGSICFLDSEGFVNLYSSTQAPFLVRNMLSLVFKIPPGRIRVHTLPLGGAFGGKAGIQLEGLAYLLSRKVGGRPIKLVNTREQEFLASPGRLGLEAEAEAGCSSQGNLTALKIRFLFDTGGYADYSVNISRAAAIACTGPYRFPNVECESLCVYTNKPFATAFRGFGHLESSFVVERIMDKLADACGLDPVTFRQINIIKPGDTTPSQSLLDENTGDLSGCLEKVYQDLKIVWKGLGERGSPFTGTNENTPGNNDPLGESENKDYLRACGVSCFWKAPAIPTNTDAGAVIFFNEDGSVNLVTGIVDLGQGTTQGLAQIAGEKLGLPQEKIHLLSGVNTGGSPHDWTTAASRSLYMAGIAVIRACDHALEQIKETAGRVLSKPREALVVSGGRVFCRTDPKNGLSLDQIVLGYTYPNGNSIGGQVIGVGAYITPDLTGIDRETGIGNPALEWTFGSVGLIVQVNKNTGHYKVETVTGCMDVGRVINPLLARGQFVGALAMGLNYAEKEGHIFSDQGILETDNLRTYKLLRYGEEPDYLISFLETPQREGPYQARGLGEQGIIGVPGALANALSRALHVNLNSLPITPETLWRAAKGADYHDPL